MKKSLPLLFTCILLLSGCEKSSTDDNDNSGGSSLPAVTLTLSPTSLVFDDSDPANNRITVSSNAAWTAQTSSDELQIDKTNGEAGETVITVTDIPYGASETLIITTVKRNETDTPKSRMAVITRDEDPNKPAPFEPEIIYADNLDKAFSDETPYLDRWDGYINATGTGVSSFSYTGSGVSIRQSKASSGYAGASGKNAFYFGRTDAYVTTGEITLPASYTSLQLTFGCMHYGETFVVNETIELSVSADRGGMKTLTYTRPTTNGGWSLGTASFTFSQPVSKIRFQMTSSNYNIRVDDLKLTTSDQPAEQILEGTTGQSYAPAELPVFVDNPDYKYITHYAYTVHSNQRVRNYTACYDTRRHNPMWVAYPYHECYKEGGFQRTEPDPWRPDPEMTEAEQSIIYPTDWQKWPWSYNVDGEGSSDMNVLWTRYNNIYFSRGHLLPSAQRGGANSELNIQTFYPTNIAPENALYYDHWSKVEYILPDNWTCSDTIFCVVGCYYGDDTHTVYDAGNYTTTTGKSKLCVIPTARYKLMLRTKKGNLGKPIAECTDDEVMAIGFWFPQNFDTEAPAVTPSLAEYIYSVKEIEKMIGGEFTFFPDAPEEAKSTVNIADWPELQNTIDE